MTLKNSQEVQCSAGNGVSPFKFIINSQEENN